MGSFKLILYYIAPTLIWGLSWYAIKFQMGPIPKNFSISLRFIIAAAILFVFCKLSKKNLRLKKSDHGFIALQALCLFTLNYLFFYKAIEYITSGVVALITSTIMFSNVLNGKFILKLPIKKSLVMLAFFGLSGVLLVFKSELKESFNDDQKLWGLIWAFIGSYITSLGNTFSSYNQSKKRDVAVTNAYGMLYASLIMFAIFLTSNEKFSFDFSTTYVSSLIFLAVGTSVISYGCYLTLIGTVGPAKAAYVFFMTPIIALAVSTIEEGYKWNIEGMFGVGIILVGCLLLLLSTVKDSKKNKRFNKNAN